MSLKVWSVAIVFAGEGAPLSSNVCIAGTAEMAAAIWAFQVGRSLPEETRPIAGVHVIEVSRDFLEVAIGAVKGAPMGAQVLSLVPSPGALPSEAEQEAAHADADPDNVA